MLTTLCVLSLDQGKIWKEPPATAPDGEPEPDQARRGWLAALWPWAAVWVRARPH